MRPQPLIAVHDVEASNRWYQQLFGCQSSHGGPNYEQLVSNAVSHHFKLGHYQKSAALKVGCGVDGGGDGGTVAGMVGVRVG